MGGGQSNLFHFTIFSIFSSFNVFAPIVSKAAGQRGVFVFLSRCLMGDGLESFSLRCLVEYQDVTGSYSARLI